MEISRRQFVKGVAGLALGLSLGERVLAEDKETLEQYRRKIFGSDYLGFHKPGLLDLLTPKAYEKNNRRYIENLTHIYYFFGKQELYSSQELWEKDKEKIINRLIQNLSLSSHFPESLMISESIRQAVKVYDPRFDYEKNIETHVNDYLESQKKIQAAQTALPRVTEKNKAGLETLIKTNQTYSRALKQQIQVEQETMFWLRWHLPEYIKDTEVDLKKTKDAFLESKEELQKIKASLAAHNHAQTLEYLQQYRNKFTQAMELFDQNISLLLEKAHVRIAENMIGRPLRKIQHRGKLFYCTREFARDWEKVQKLVRKVS